MTQEKLQELHSGLETAYINETVASNLAYRPQFVSNNYKEGKKVLSSIEEHWGQTLWNIVIGNVADDNVFKTVDMYFRGLWDKKKVLEELRYYKMNDQICIVNQETLDQILVFENAYEVESNDK